MRKSLKDQIKLYKVIANETRLTILLEASKEEEGLPFEKLRGKLRLNPNALDYHLEKLTNAGLIINVPRVPVTKRTRRSEVLHSMTLSTMRKQRRIPMEGKRYYSYYKITETGKEILEKIGVRTETLKK